MGPHLPSNRQVRGPYWTPVLAGQVQSDGSGVRTHHPRSRIKESPKSVYRKEGSMLKV